MATRHRYELLDAYTLEELRREYLSSDTRGRIRLTVQLDWSHYPRERHHRLSSDELDAHQNSDDLDFVPETRGQKKEPCERDQGEHK